jgi:hypothetical protein
MPFRPMRNELGSSSEVVPVILSYDLIIRCSLILISDAGLDAGLDADDPNAGLGNLVIIDPVDSVEYLLSLLATPAPPAGDSTLIRRLIIGSI